MAKNSENNSDDLMKNIALAILAVGAAYGFASWAIDSGSLWHYSFTFIALYFSGRYIKLVISRIFQKNGKSTKTRRATK